MAYKWMIGYKKKGTSIGTEIKMKAFAVAYFKEGDAEKAALSVGYKASSAAVRGRQLLMNDIVIAELTKLRKRATSKEIATIEWRREMLQKIAETHIDTANSTSLAAIAELNKMDGAYAPTKVETKNLNIDADLALVKQLVEDNKKEY